MSHYNNHAEMKDNPILFGDTFTCAKCGEVKPMFSDATKTLCPEYGIMPNSDDLHCWQCCGEWDKEYMRANDKYTLYFHNGMISNWPGTLKLKANGVTVGRHNIAGKQYSGRFVFEGRVWSFRVYGDNTEIAHCKKMK